MKLEDMIHYQFFLAKMAALGYNLLLGRNMAQRGVTSVIFFVKLR